MIIVPHGSGTMHFQLEVFRISLTVEIGACGGCTVRPFKGHASGAEKTLLRKQSGGRHTQPLGPMEEFHEV
jgi:hypothetical protein